MVHETPDARAFFAEARNMIKPGGSLFYVEPKFHVSRKEFNGMIQEAEYSGWLSNGAPPLSMSHTALLC
jgi:2-polyprenyl-3-methyl-5-hydroxy-6-metoxy-1,4-benzoquinol methylase